MKPVTITLFAALTLCGSGVAALAQSVPSDAAAATIFSRLDADQDGAVSATEINARKAAQFARADRNGDGKVDGDEMAAVRDRMSRLAGMAKHAGGRGPARLDRDGDGAVSLAEYTATSPIFVLIDANDDGALSRAEFDRARTVLTN